MRFGVVLTPRGGALAKMLVPFRLGLGARLGGGEQRMPWIALADAVSALGFALRRPELSGAVNAVAPESVTNAQLTDTLASVLGRCDLPSGPAVAVKADVRLGDGARDAADRRERPPAQARGTPAIASSTRACEDALEAMLGRGSSRAQSTTVVALALLFEVGLERGAHFGSCSARMRAAR